MNKAELAGVIRTFAAFGLGFMVKEGWIDGDQAVALGGALATLLVARWSVRSKRKAA